MKPIIAAARRCHSACALLLCAALALTSFTTEVRGVETPPADNPLYSGYIFRKTPKTITFGSQPLATPIGVIAEVMKRDRILGKALAARGEALNVLPFLKGPDINQYIKKGDLDIAMGGDMPTVTLATSSDIIIAGFAKLGPCSIVTHKKYNQINELRGKRIGVPEWTTAHVGLLVALETAGMRESDIKTIFMEVDELKKALAEGRIDAFSAWEPAPEQAVDENPNLAIIHRFMNFSYIFLRRDFVEKNPETAYLLLAAYLRGLRWMNLNDTNLTRAAEWAVASTVDFQKKPFSTVEQIRAITRENILKYAEAPILPLSDMEQRGHIVKLFNFLKQKGKLPADVDWDRVNRSLDRSLLQGILAVADQYQIDSFDYNGM